MKVELFSTTEELDELEAAFAELMADEPDVGPSRSVEKIRENIHTPRENGKTTERETKKEMEKQKMEQETSLDAIKRKIAELKKMSEDENGSNATGEKREYVKAFVGKRSFRVIPFDGNVPYVENRDINLSDTWFTIGLSKNDDNPVTAARTAAFKSGKKELGKKLFGKVSVTVQVIDIDDGGKLKLLSLKERTGGEELKKVIYDSVEQDVNIFGLQKGAHNIVCTVEKKPMGDNQTFDLWHFSIAVKPGDAIAEPAKLYSISDVQKPLSPLADVVVALTKQLS